MPQLQHPEIIEVWERAEQGHANAYHCGADDGHSYYVKSQGATWRGLVCEWVAARLALVFGLPIAPFAQVSLDDGFAQFLQRAGNRHLVSGWRLDRALRPIPASLNLLCCQSAPLNFGAIWSHLTGGCATPTALWVTIPATPICCGIRSG